MDFRDMNCYQSTALKTESTKAQEETPPPNTVRIALTTVVTDAGEQAKRIGRTITAQKNGDHGILSAKK